MSVAPSPQWLLAVTGPALAHGFDPGTTRRGHDYAAQGRVVELDVTDDGWGAVGHVRGSGGGGYVTSVRLTTGAGRTAGTPLVSGSCSCPLQWDCKHVVAVALAVAQRLRRPSGAPAPSPGTPGPPAPPAVRPEWERVLAELAGEPDGGTSASSPLPLALGAEVVPASTHRYAVDPRPRLRLRPLVPGRSGRWVKAGASWADVETPWTASRFVAAHARLLADLGARARARRYRGGTYYPSSAEGVHLDDLAVEDWALLDALAEAGVPLVAVARQLSVRRVPPVEVVLDAVRSGGDVLVRAALSSEGRELPLQGPGAVQVVGQPAGSVWWRHEAELLLGPLERPLPVRAADWLRAGGEARVPAEDVPRFVGGLLPALAKAVHVRSVDGSVEPPEVQPPRLAALVQLGAGHVADVSWELRYRVGERVVPLPLAEAAPGGVPAGPAPEGVLRDRVAEAALLARVLAGAPGEALARVPRLLDRPTAGRTALRPQVRLEGMATAVLCAEVLPALRDEPDVEVVVAGVVLDYREAEDEPVVEVGVAEAPVGTDWFDLDVRVRLGERVVPMRPLFVALVQGVAELLLEDGTWFSLDRPELEHLRDLLAASRDLEDREPGQLRVTPLHVGLYEELVSLGVVAEQSERWRRAVDGLLRRGEVDPAPDPAGLEAVLRPYQRTGYRWLAALAELGLGGVLADDMGLGKTVQALAAVLRLRETGATGPVLVVAPTSVVDTWASEAERFAPSLRVAAVRSTRRRSGSTAAEVATGADLVVTSYALLRIDAADYAAVEWAGLVLDEAQFVKNRRTATYAAARKVRAPFRLAITGTPMENSLMDLWALLSLTAPGLFPSPDRFTDRYRIPIEGGGSTERLEELRRRVRPLLLRRSKDEVAPELPPKQEQVLAVPLTAPHQAVYDTHLQRERKRVLGLLESPEKNRIAILRSLVLLRQLALDPALVDAEHAGHGHSAKVQVLLEHVRELAAEGHRALVFSQFTGYLRRVQQALEAAGVATCYLDGRTRDRPARIAEFRDGDAPVFLISLKAGGFGLTLTEADYVFVMDPWWNPAAEEQAVDRTHRIGQTRPVNVYRLVSRGTIEEKVVELQERKRRLASSVLAGGAASWGGLSPDDVRALLAP